MASVRRSARRVAQGVLWGLTAVHVAEAVMLRKRRNLLAALPDAGDDGSTAPARDLAAKVDVIALAGTAPDDVTAAAARAELDACGAQVVDLVPGDLPAERALRLLRRIEPEKLGRDPFYTPGGAHEAVIVDPSVTARMAGGAGERPAPRPRRDGAGHAAGPASRPDGLARAGRAPPAGRPHHRRRPVAGAGAADGLLAALRCPAPAAGGGRDGPPGGHDRRAARRPRRRGRGPRVVERAAGRGVRRPARRRVRAPAPARHRRRQPDPPAPRLGRERRHGARRPARHPGPGRGAPGRPAGGAPAPRRALRAPPRRLLLVRVGGADRAARRDRPAPAQAGRVPPGRVRRLRPRVPEPRAHGRGPRLLLRRRL